MTEIAWISLPEPRRLSAAEQAVLDRLVARAGDDRLTAQAASVLAVATCSCGCRSVQLRSDAPPIPPEAMRRLSPTGREDWVSFSADEQQLSLVLHVIQGSLHDLEIYHAS